MSHTSISLCLMDLWDQNINQILSDLILRMWLYMCVSVLFNKYDVYLIKIDHMISRTRIINPLFSAFLLPEAQKDAQYVWF